MVSTNKVLTLSAGIIATDCMLAGMAIAGLTGQGVGTMSETLSVALTLVVILAALNTVLIKLHIKDWRERRKGSDSASDLLGDALEEDMDAKALLTSLAAMIGRHDEALKPLIEDYALRRAEAKAGELPPL